MSTETELERIRKLLAKAEGTSNENEREAYLAKATDLMLKHGINEALLRQEQKKSGAVREKPTTRTIDVTGIYSRYHVDMLNRIAKAFGVRLIQSPAYRSSDVRVYLVGFPSDLDLVETLYTSLLLQATSAMKQSLKNMDKWERPKSGTPAFHWRRNFIYGFGVVVGQRLYDQQHRAVEEHSSKMTTEIALRDRETDVNLAVKERFPYLKMGRGVSVGFSGQGEGRRAGERADIGNKPIPGGRRGIERG